ncbi:hypothetical protein INT45_007100 [Circinella minor]|uniref:Uncharacterized protein n=1 Tax=Circinella minor TaxID=1195481 RepID=A0A8H7SCR5_9FUNG|nr:hypothetical protein INT45_007100 [Circinella minor]
MDFNDDNKQLGFLQNFSLSQLNGFLKAFRIYSGREEHEGLRYLKGCYMHWIDATLNQCVAIMINEFPGSRRWIRCWLQPKICSMIFNSQSLMKPTLRTHSIRTGNACENYHSILYRNMPKKMPLLSALNCLLKFAANDEEDIRQFYEHGILPTPNRTPRIQPNSRLGSIYYQVSDSRPPDHNAVLFAEESEDERENDAPQQIKQLELLVTHLMVPNNDDLQIVCDNEIGIAHMVENDCLTLQADDPIVECSVQQEDDKHSEPLERGAIPSGEDQDTKYNKDEEELRTDQYNENDYIVEGPDNRMNIDNNNNNPHSPQSIVEQLPPSPADSIDFVINRVNRLIQEADELFPPRDGDNQESTFVPPLTKDIYDLRLNPWNSNSCYIDAAVELLWHSIIPVINVYNPTSFKIETDHEAGNPLDILMKETYNMSQNWTQRFDGSNRMRNYV